MIIRTAAWRPAKLALRFLDRQIVDACDSTLHQSMFVELPVLVAVGAEPVARVIAPFVSEAHGDASFVKRPQFLDQTIIELFRPFAPEKLDNGLAPGEEFGAVAPVAVDGVNE